MTDDQPGAWAGGIMSERLRRPGLAGMMTHSFQAQRYDDPFIPSTAL